MLLSVLQTLKEEAAASRSGAVSKPTLDSDGAVGELLRGSEVGSHISMAIVGGALSNGLRFTRAALLDREDVRVNSCFQNRRDLEAA